MQTNVLTIYLKQMFNEANQPEVKDEIIDAARDLFVHKGFKGTTIRDIAAASGTNVAMVNYYFRSKDKLFESIFEEAFVMLSAKIFSAVDSELPFFDMIRQWVYSYYDVLSQYPQLPIFVLNELSQNPAMLEEKMILNNPDQFYSKLETRIKTEILKGTIKEIPVSDFLLNIVSLSIFPFVFSPVATKFLNLPQVQYDDLLEKHKEYVVEFIINAIKPEA